MKHVPGAASIAAAIALVGALAPCAVLAADGDGSWDFGPPVTDLTTPYTVRIQRNAMPGYYGGVAAAVHVHTTVQPGTTSYEWNLLARIYNRSDLGENVALYAQGYKQANGPTWAGVFEVRDSTSVGAVWGLEVDVMSNGEPNNQRIGVGVVVGKHAASAGKAVTDYGYLLTPFGGDDGQGEVVYGIRIQTRCRVACLSIRGGEAIALADDPAVGRLRFDPVTGYAGFWRADGLLVWGINQSNGDEQKMWRP